MPARRTAPGPPPFYIATAVIPAPSDPDSGVLPPAAYQPGMHVPAQAVEENGWHALVRPPDGWPEPATDSPGPGRAGNEE